MAPQSRARSPARPAGPAAHPGGGDARCRHRPGLASTSGARWCRQPRPALSTPAHPDGHPSSCPPSFHHSDLVRVGGNLSGVQPVNRIEAWLHGGPADGSVRSVECGPDGPPELLMLGGGGRLLSVPPTSPWRQSIRCTSWSRTPSRPGHCGHTGGSRRCLQAEAGRYAKAGNAPPGRCDRFDAEAGRAAHGKALLVAPDRHW
jgi:hypothetical protein